MDVSDILSFLEQSDPLAIAAIIITLLIGGINFIQSRRAFNAAYHPSIQPTLKTRTCAGGNCLALKMKNLSNEHAVSNLTIEVRVREPRKFPAFWNQGRVAFTKRYPSLERQQEISVDHIPENHPNLEDFFVQESPGWVINRSAIAPLDIYHITREGKAVIQVKIRYNPGVSVRDRISFIKRYQLIPKTSPEQSGIRQILAWEVREVG
ncbi:MAG TPA: hypothetical protein PKL21_08625 [Anaerolineaceae bacterium]|nr:hypothetical protein [Anaerolineaceae bacterium]